MVGSPGAARARAATAVALRRGRPSCAGRLALRARRASVELAVPGAHNALNAAAALTACAARGRRRRGRRRALADFQGAGRRFEALGATRAGALVVDDYAHHPTEVRATLEAARTLEPRRVVAVFQPHLFSRTQRQARAFGAALARPTSRWSSTSIPRASAPRTTRASPACWSPRRPPTPPAASAWRGCRTHATARGLPASELATGDLLLTLGAGDVERDRQGTRR